MENPDLVLQETGSSLTHSRLNYVPFGDTLRRDAISSFRTRSYNHALLMATDQPLLTNWAIQPLMSAKMRISPVSWTVSIETDLRAGGASPPGTFPWFYTSSQRLPLNPLKRPP